MTAFFTFWGGLVAGGVGGIVLTVAVPKVYAWVSRVFSAAK